MTFQNDPKKLPLKKTPKNSKKCTKKSIPKFKKKTVVTPKIDPRKITP